MTYRALFLDVDGTLVHKKSISPANRKAIFSALKRGVKITIASGRGDFMVLPMAHDLYLDAFGESYSIALNGSEIIKNCECPLPHISSDFPPDYLPDFSGSIPDRPRNPMPKEIKNFSILENHTMPKEVSDELIAIGNQNRIYFHIYKGNSVYFMVPENPRFKKFTKYDGNFYCMACEPDIEKRMEHYKKQPFVDNLNLLAPKVYENYKTPSNVQKIIFLNNNAALLDKCLREAMHLKDKIHMEYSDSHSLEFTPIEAGKGKGVLTVANALGISPDETIAMGDGENDLTMLNAAGLSVVPANSLYTVKEQADRVLSLSCGEDAVAYVINEYFL